MVDVQAFGSFQFDIGIVYNLTFFFRILSIFNTHTGRGEKILKKLIVVYIKKGSIHNLTR